MSYGIHWDKKALDFLRKSDKQVSVQIIKKVNSIVDNPEHYLEFLVGMDERKLRVGDYRVLVYLDNKNKVIKVLFIGHRRDIYKK